MNNNKLVAIHDELPIVIKFMNDQPNHDYDIIKIKKKFMKKLKDTEDYTDLYLVRYNDNYIPYSLYETYKRSTEGSLYDLKFTKDILYRILEDNDMTSKEQRHISKTIEYISSLIEDTDISMPLSSLNKLKRMDDEYKERISRD